MTGDRTLFHLKAHGGAGWMPPKWRPIFTGGSQNRKAPEPSPNGRGLFLEGRKPATPTLGQRLTSAPAIILLNVLDRTFEAPAPNRKWIADFTYVWSAEGWLYVAAVVDQFSRRVVGWSMSAEMTAQSSL
jgi:transposase InsO family protein